MPKNIHYVMCFMPKGQILFGQTSYTLDTTVGWFYYSTLHFLHANKINK